MAWHPTIDELQSLVDGELDASARRSVEAHLQMCDRCRAIAARLWQVSDSVRAVGRATPPDDLHGRILSATARASSVRELTCTECTELASSYLDRELTGPDRDAFEAHVFTCERCHAAFKHMERTAGILRDAPPAPAPPELPERISAALAAESGARRVGWRRTAGILTSLAAAAAVLFAVFVHGGHDATGPEGQATAVVEQPAEVESAQPADGTVVAGVPDDEAAEETAGESAAVAHATSAGTREAPTRPDRATRESRPVRHERATTPPSQRAEPSAEAVAEPVGDAPADAAESEAPADEPASPVGPHTGPPAHDMMIAASPGPGDGSPAAAEMAGTAPATAVRVEPSTPVAPEPDSSAAPVVTSTPRAHALTAQPEPPTPEPQPAAEGSEDTETRDAPPLRIASNPTVVPRQVGATTLYRATDEPRVSAHARVSERVRRDQRPEWDAGRIGIEIR